MFSICIDRFPVQGERVTFTEASAVRDYIVAGRGIVTLRSVRTGVHYTFKVSKPSRVDGPRILFVSVLVGPETYEYVGHIGLAVFDPKYAGEACAHFRGDEEDTR